MSFEDTSYLPLVPRIELMLLQVGTCLQIIGACLLMLAMDVKCCNCFVDLS